MCCGNGRRNGWRKTDWKCLKKRVYDTACVGDDIRDMHTLFPLTLNETVMECISEENIGREETKVMTVKKISF